MLEASLFDVNETLLDLSLLKKFVKQFKDDYEDFGELSIVVLKNVFNERGKSSTYKCWIVGFTRWLLFIRCSEQVIY